MEQKKEGTLSMVIASGIFIVGRLVGGNKLLKPRIFQIIENGSKIQLSPFPSTPAFIRIPMDALAYPIPEKDTNLTDLYERVTNPQVDPGLN